MYSKVYTCNDFQATAHITINMQIKDMKIANKPKIHSHSIAILLPFVQIILSQSFLHTIFIMNSYEIK